MNGFDFERYFVSVLVELSEKKGRKAAPLARDAWPHNKDAATKWRKIRNGDPPQELSMRDAFDLAQALGVSMTEVCGIIQGRVMESALANKALAVETFATAPKEIPQSRRTSQDNKGEAMPVKKELQAEHNHSPGSV